MSLCICVLLLSCAITLRMSIVQVGDLDTSFFKSGLFWRLFFFPFFTLCIFTTSPSAVFYQLPVFSPLLQCLSSVPLSFLIAVGGSGGEVLLTGRDSLPEGEAEPLRLSRRLHHCHHRQEAAAASESDGAATGGELQVGVTVAEERHFEIYIMFLSFKEHATVMLTSCGLADQG